MYVLKVPEAAKMLKVSEQKVRELVRRKKIASLHDQRTIRIFNPFSKTRLPKFMSVDEAAQIFRIGTAKVRYLLKTGKLVGYENGETYKLTAIVDERPIRIRGYKVC